MTTPVSAAARRMLKRSPFVGRSLVPMIVLRHRSFLNSVGWFKSFQSGMSIAGDGSPLPWFTYPAIHFLEGRVRQHMRVFEFGSGMSTLWWARRVSTVISCEHDRKWHSCVQDRVPPNAHVHHIPLEINGRYSRFSKEFKEGFEVIVVDGRDRVNCIRNSMETLAADGVFIVDNSDRTEYGEGCEFLLSREFKCLEFKGMGPVNAQEWCTSIYYRADNCLGL